MPQDVAKREPSASERFTDKVIQQFKATAGSDIELSAFQKRLIQNYFVGLDISLRAAEEKRLAKSESNRDKLPISWANVNMEQLAVNVVACSRIGLDPACKNHINMMPFKNNHTNKYDIVFMEGYRGMELKASKYGLDVPEAVVIEVVYETDEFAPIKRDINNKVEGYHFRVTNAFKRGEIVGGFYYMMFADASKNRLQFFDMKAIEKRKPKWASPEFWGGEKAIWKGGQKTNQTEVVEGWLDEMVYKTLARAAYGSITIDSKKIDDAYIAMMNNEQQQNQLEIEANANQELLGFTDAQVVEEQKPAEPSQAEPPTVPGQAGAQTEMPLEKPPF